MFKYQKAVDGGRPFFVGLEIGRWRLHVARAGDTPECVQIKSVVTPTRYDSPRAASALQQDGFTMYYYPPVGHGPRTQAIPKQRMIKSSRAGREGIGNMQ
jgi:hypothetical protein